MCGHVGTAGNLYQKDLDFFREGLYVDALRGMHSTGMAVVKNNWQTEVHKKATSPLPMMHDGTGDFWRLLSCQNRLFLGHNRHATVGEVINTNAHPFEFEHVVGAHNGTLRGRSDDALIGRKGFGTDSETLFYNINEFGVEEIIPEVQGAWALVWVNKTERTLNFLRNSERLFFYCFSKTGQNIYWASEIDMLRWIIRRNGIEISDQGFLSLNENKWVRWEMPANFSQKWDAPEVSDLKGWEHKTTVGFQQGPWNGWSPQKGAAAGPSSNLPPTTGNPLAASANDSKPKSSPVKLLNAPAGKPDSKPKTNVDPMTQAVLPGLTKTETHHGTHGRTTDPYVLGKRAGLAGRSYSANPFTGGQKMREWNRGRLDGVEEAVGYGANNGNVRVFAVRGFNNESLTEQEWKRRTGQTCSCCDQVIEFSAMVDATWVSSDTFYCDDCVEQTKFSSEFLKESA